MRIVLILLAFLGPIGTVSAQEPLHHAADREPRIELLDPGRFVSTPMTFGPNPIGDVPHVAERSLPDSHGTARRLEAHRGRKPSVLGGVIGFAVGGVAGGLVGCSLNRDDYGVFCAGQSDTKVFLGAVVGGAVGGAVGALLFSRKR